MSMSNTSQHIIPRVSRITHYGCGGSTRGCSAPAGCSSPPRCGASNPHSGIVARVDARRRAQYTVS